MYQISAIARFSAHDPWPGPAVAVMAGSACAIENRPADRFRESAPLLLPGSLLSPPRPYVSNSTGAIRPCSIPGESSTLDGRVREPLSNRLWLPTLGCICSVACSGGAALSNLPLVRKVERTQKRLVAQLYLKRAARCQAHHSARSAATGSTRIARR